MDGADGGDGGAVTSSSPLFSFHIRYYLALNFVSPAQHLHASPRSLAARLDRGVGTVAFVIGGGSN